MGYTYEGWGAVGVGSSDAVVVVDVEVVVEVEMEVEGGVMITTEGLMLGVFGGSF